MEQINSVLRGDKLWLRKSHGKPVEEPEILTLQKNQKFTEKTSFNMLHVSGNGGKKNNPLLNTQHQANIKYILTTKDLLWCVCYSNLS